MTVSVDIVLDSLERIPQRKKEILSEASMRASLMMRRYVPLEEGALRGSEPSSSRYDAGILIWNTPYAAKHYYVPMRHSAAGTSDHWDERFKSNDMPAYLQYVEDLYGRYAS